MTSRELVAQAVELMVQAVVARLSEQAAPAAPSIMSAAEAAREEGYSGATVSKWCQTGLIHGASHRGRGGKWRFARSAWEQFLRDGKRRPRSRRTA